MKRFKIFYIVLATILLLFTLIHLVKSAKDVPKAIKNQNNEQRLNEVDESKNQNSGKNEESKKEGTKEKKKKICLTFDDGPETIVTPQILNILKSYNVKATFFVCGNKVKKHPEMLRKILDEGHVIANHSWDHPQFTKISLDKVDFQINSTNDAIEHIIGKKPRLFRPPYGDLNPKLKTLIKKSDFEIIFWDIDTLDWNGKSSDSIFENIKLNARDGSIVLQHNTSEKLQNTVDSLRRVIEYLLKSSFELVTVDQLMKVKAYK